MISLKLRVVSWTNIFFPCLTAFTHNYLLAFPKGTRKKEEAFYQLQLKDNKHIFWVWAYEFHPRKHQQDLHIELRPQEWWTKHYPSGMNQLKRLVPYHLASSSLAGDTTAGFFFGGGAAFFLEKSAMVLKVALPLVMEQIDLVAPLRCLFTAS